MSETTIEGVRQAHEKIRRMWEELEEEKLTLIVHPDQLSAIEQGLLQMEAEAALKIQPFVRPHVHSSELVEPGQAVLFRAKRFNYLGEI